MTKTETLPEIKKVFTYEAYKNLVLGLAERSGTTGLASEEHVAATKINAQRINRIDKHFVPNIALLEAISRFKRNCTWLIIAESWCGDGAQSIPVIAHIAGLCPYVELKVILRDENPEIMDAFLTNGCRAIPKLIVIDKKSEAVIGTWGPRPENIRQMADQYRLEHPDASHEMFVTNLHLLYGRDQSRSVQTEFTKLLDQWNIIVQ